ncbi:MAG: hypothetical protein ACO276_05480 [Ilumatobacteraceae bacterium]
MGKKYVKGGVRDPHKDKIRDLANAGVKSRFNPGVRHARRLVKRNYRAKAKWSGQASDRILDKVDNLAVLKRWTEKVAPKFDSSDEFYSFVIRNFRGSFAARHAAQHILQSAPYWLGCTCNGDGPKVTFSKVRCACGAFGSRS